jgi:hypothetical protein
VEVATKKEEPKKEEPKKEEKKEPAKAAAKADDWGDDWGDSWGPSPQKALPLDTRNIDYNKLDLNKLSDYELNQHKAAMEMDFNKNFIKKGDAGFEYDKRVDFSKVQKIDESWDDDYADEIEGDNVSEPIEDCYSDAFD